MRILVFGMSGRLTGGIETFLMNMNACMSRDCVFDYVIMDTPNVHLKQVRENGGECYDVTPVKKNPFKSFAELHRVIGKKRTDHPVAYFNLFSMVHVLPVFLCRMKGYRIVLHAHNSNLQQKNRIYAALHRLGRALLKNMKCLRLTNSDLSADFMFGKNSGAKLIFNAIDMERFRFCIDRRNEIRQKYHVEDRVVIGFAGRLSEPKNPLFLVDIFKEFHALLTESVLMIAGDGELRGDVEKRIREYGLSEDVILTGTVDDIEKYYQAFDLFLLPSRFEGLGIALVEAQTAGLPVVTSKGVVPEIATVTPRCIRKDLKAASAEWAEDALKLYRDCAGSDRTAGYDYMKNTDFNIKTESRKLERILMSEGTVQ